MCPGKVHSVGTSGQLSPALDDVIVDGLAIANEDAISAREKGRRIVEVLKRF
jgi:hypothetical protein